MFSLDMAVKGLFIWIFLVAVRTIVRLPRHSSLGGMVHVDMSQQCSLAGEALVAVFTVVAVYTLVQFHVILQALGSVNSARTFRTLEWSLRVLTARTAQSRYIEQLRHHRTNGLGFSAEKWCVQRLASHTSHRVVRGFFFEYW